LLTALSAARATSTPARVLYTTSPSPLLSHSPPGNRCPVTPGEYRESHDGCRKKRKKGRDDSLPLVGVSIRPAVNGRPPETSQVNLAASRRSRVGVLCLQPG